MDIERTKQSLRLVLGFLEDNYHLDLAKELRKTQRKLALWRQGCCKPRRGHVYRFGLDLIDRLDIDPNEPPSALMFDRKVIGLQFNDIRETVPIFIFNAVFSRPRPEIQFYLDIDDLRYLYTGDDDEYTTLNYKMPYPSDGGTELSITIKIHNGNMIYIPAAELTTIEQIWNAVAQRTQQTSFELFVDDQLIEPGSLIGNLKLGKPIVQKLIDEIE